MQYIFAISEKHWLITDPLWTIKSEEEKSHWRQKAYQSLAAAVEIAGAKSIFIPMDEEGKPTMRIYPTIERDDQHIDNVCEVYESLKDKLNGLLADLQPTAWYCEPVNPRITDVYSLIQTLRDLACK